MDASNIESDSSISGVQADEIQQQLVQEVLRKFRLVAASIKGQSRQANKHSKISQAQVWAIHLIAQSPGLRVKDLAREMSVKSTTVSNLLEKLDRAGYVTRLRSDRDQRIVRLYLTNEAKTLLHQLSANPKGTLPNALVQLPQHELLSLDSHLSNLVTVLQAEP